jgi:mono/diheme cytochrome c family protein
VKHACVAVALAGAIAACGDAPRETPADTALVPPSAGDTTVVPSDTGAPQDTTESAASADVPRISIVLVADSAAGDSIFNRRGTCFTCHGERGVGMANLGPDLRDAEWLHGDGSFRSIMRVITEGVAVPKASPIGMPAFIGRLSEVERYRVAAYVFSLSHPGSVVVDTTTIPFDTMSLFSVPAPAVPPR